MTMNQVKIIRNQSGRTGLFRSAGCKSWHRIPVRQAEKALKEGKLDYGFERNIPVIGA
jgi:hypothetical protein